VFRVSSKLYRRDSTDSVPGILIPVDWFPMYHPRWRKALGERNKGNGFSIQGCYTDYFSLEIQDCYWEVSETSRTKVAGELLVKNSQASWVQLLHIKQTYFWPLSPVLGLWTCRKKSVVFTRESLVTKNRLLCGENGNMGLQHRYYWREPTPRDQIEADSMGALWFSNRIMISCSRRILLTRPQGGFRQAACVVWSCSKFPWISIGSWLVW
jgi:hypothetical protein